MYRKTLSVLVAILFLASAQSVLAQEDKAPKQTLFTNVNIFDGKNERLAEGMSVLVEGNLIKEIGKDIRAVDGTTIIDGGGRTLMPGLIDGHNHITLPASPLALAYNMHWGESAVLMAREAGRMLMRGFTTLRDAGGPAYGIAKAIDKGIVPGPRIYPSGHFIGQTSGHFDFRLLNETHPRSRSERSSFEREWSFIADGDAEVTAYTREALRLGATQIKVSLGGGNSSPYDPLDTIHYEVLEIRAAVRAAENWNTYVLVHAYTDESVMRALEAGVKSIDHGNLIKDEKTILAIKEAGAMLNPQFLIFTPDEEMLAAGDPATIAKGAPLRENVEHLVKLIKKHDLQIAFGVDLFGSPELMAMQNLELTRRARWWSPAEVLTQATSITARLVAMSGPRNPYPDGPLGVIQEGAYADILVVNGNPLENIALLENPQENLVVIMKDGKVYKNTLN